MSLARCRHGARRRVARAFSASAAPHGELQARIRALMRETAQPVAVVTSIMPPDGGAGASHRLPVFHGATLSSFTSIAMDPHPLTAFALRLPSRMSTALKAANEDWEGSHMVVNLLSSAQQSLARKFARPDLHHDPFSTTQYHLNADGIPILDGSLGALTCRLISAAVPLYDRVYLNALGSGSSAEAVIPKLKRGEVMSELFVAEVLNVEESVALYEGQDDLQSLPLLYHRQAFTTILPPPTPLNPPDEE
ncbi:flavin reductase like domain-containing protein [Schizophyllum fasciatum]